MPSMATSLLPRPPTPAADARCSSRGPWSRPPRGAATPRRPAEGGGGEGGGESRATGGGVASGTPRRVPILAEPVSHRHRRPVPGSTEREKYAPLQGRCGAGGLSPAHSEPRPAAAHPGLASYSQVQRTARPDATPPPSPRPPPPVSTLRP